MNNYYDNISNLKELYNKLKISKSKTEKGTIFENFTKDFLLLTQSGNIKEIYLTNDVPIHIKNKVRYIKPPHGDKGIDLFIVHHDDSVSIGQSKYKRNIGRKLGEHDISNTILQSSQYIYKHMYVMTNILPYEPSDSMTDEFKSKLRSIGRHDIDRYPNIINDIKNYHINNVKPEIVYEPPQMRPYQIDAIQAVVDEFRITNKAILAMTMGGGKTLISIKIAERLDSANVLFLVPSCDLVAQFSEEWKTHYRPNENIDFLNVASNVRCPKDNTLSTTSPNVIHNFMSRDNKKVIISTYKSASKLLYEYNFDFVIFDEAHRSIRMNNLLTSSTFDRKLFMTATPKVSSKEPDNNIHNRLMNNENIFGRIVYRYSLFQGIRDGYLCDYMIEVPYCEEDGHVNVDGKQYHISVISLISNIYKNMLNGSSKKILIFNTKGR
jgi:predicted helicase